MKSSRGPKQCRKKPSASSSNTMSPVARRRVGGAVIAALSAMLFSPIECLRPVNAPDGRA